MTLFHKTSDTQILAKEEAHEKISLELKRASAEVAVLRRLLADSQANLNSQLATNLELQRECSRRSRQ